MIALSSFSLVSVSAPDPVGLRTPDGGETVVTPVAVPAELPEPVPDCEFVAPEFPVPELPAVPDPVEVDPVVPLVPSVPVSVSVFVPKPSSTIVNVPTFNGVDSV